MAKKRPTPPTAAAASPNVTTDDKIRGRDWPTLEKAVAEADRLRAVLSQVDRFTAIITDQDAEIDEVRKTVATAKSVFEKAKDDLAELIAARNRASADLVKFLKPKQGEVMPLFDTMAPADEDTHGRNCHQWRAEPIAVLRLSGGAHNALIDAEIVLVGQLQDRMIAKPKDWADGITGLTAGSAAAVADALNAFICDRSEQ